MIQGLEKIKTFEDYELARKDLEYCLHEYKWISDSKNPKKEVEEELKECMKLLRANMDRDEELNLLSRIHTLKTKYIAIVRDEYKNELRTNIIGLFLTTEQFEAASQEVSFSDIITGLLRGNHEIKSYLKKKYMFTLSNIYGIVPAPQSLNIEKMDEILDYIAKNYELVDIDLSDRNERNEDLSLIPTEEPIGLKADIIKNINNTIDECINSFENKETSVKTNSNEKDDDKKSHHEKNKGHANEKMHEEEKGEIEK